MKMFRASIAAILGIAMSSAAFGRIGETKEQCVERYGEPKGTQPARLAKSDAEADLFEHAGIKVVVEYRGGQAWVVSYADRKMNQTNAEKILANYAEGSGAKWEGPTAFSGVKHWADTKGGQHAALYGSPQFKLVVFAKAAVDASYKPVVFLSEVEEEPAPADADEKEDEEPAPVTKDPFSGF